MYLLGGVRRQVKSRVVSGRGGDGHYRNLGAGGGLVVWQRRRSVGDRHCGDGACCRPVVAGVGAGVAGGGAGNRCGRCLKSDLEQMARGGSCCRGFNGGRRGGGRGR